MARLREPLVLPFLAFAAGIVCQRFVSFDTREALLPGTVLFVLAYLAARRDSIALSRTALLLGFVSMGILIGLLRAPKPVPVLDTAQGELVSLTGCVIEPPKFMPDREQFVMELAPGARAQVSLYLKEGEPPPHLEYGQRVSIEGRIRRPRNFRNEGAFDIETFLARRQIFWTVGARSGAPVEIQPGKCGDRATAVVYGLRGWLLDRMDRFFGNDAPKVAALLLGESAKLDREWTNSFRKTGTYHALVVSGTHVTILAGALTFLLRAFFVPQFPALLATTALTWLYAILAGGSIPVMRAAAGFTLFLVCKFFYRRARLLNVLAAVAWGFLLYDPRQLFDASFHLSFGALAAIAGIALPLDEHFLEPYRKGLRHITDIRHDIRLPARIAQFRVELRLLAETVALWTRLPFSWVLRTSAFLLSPLCSIAALVLVSAAVQLVLAVPFIVYFHRFAISAVLANVGVVSFLEAAICTGFAATLTGLPPLIWLTQWLIDTSATLSGWHLRWEPDFRVPDPPFWLAIFALATVAASAWALRKSLRWGVPALVASAAAAAVLILYPFPADARQSELELTVIDVGQGDALFVVYPDGTRMAIDAGGIAQFGRRTKPMDIGEAVVAPYLWTRSIRSIEILVLTHAHADHMGGIAALIDDFHPRELWISGLGKSPEFESLLSHARRRGIRIRTLRRGYSARFGEATVNVVAPDPEAENEDTPKNDDSLSLLVRFGERSFLLPGDAERAIEQQLVADESFGKIDVLKVAHHGGRTSTTFDFIEKSRPAFAIISVGEANRYNHPHAEVLDRLTGAHATILRTDRDGRITLRTDGRRVTLDTHRWAHLR